jgi:hypothetical protein
MKKVLFLILTIFLFASCEKETKLSDYVVGTWKSQELVLGDSPFGTFTAIINSDNTYTLSFRLSDGSASITCPPTGYSIDDSKNQITIDEPDFDPNDNQTPTGTQTFDVEWEKDSRVMTWLPLNTGDGGAPTLVWTRQ